MSVIKTLNPVPAKAFLRTTTYSANYSQHCIILNGFKHFLEWFVEHLNNITLVKIRSDEEFVASDFLVKKVRNLCKGPKSPLPIEESY